MLNTINRSIIYLIVLSSCGIVKTGRGSFMVYREIWHAVPVEENNNNRTKPSNWVIIHESGGPTCHGSEDCIACLRELQMKDLRTKGDIRYNFLIGGDGMVYEGRGWYKNSISIPEYDSESISVAFIGTYSEVFISTSAWDALKNFLTFAEAYRFLSKNYKTVAHRQFTIIPEVYPIYQAHCPGYNIFKLFSTLSHWSNETIVLYR